MEYLFRRVALVGVGMVGGSLGRALLVRKLAKDVIGVDPHPGVGEKALALGAVTQVASLEEAVAGADLVVLAAPVRSVLELLPKIAPLLTAGALVSDVCSTKLAVAQRAATVLPGSVAFVGGHPMAGSEKDGVEALDENLFENAVYVLTPAGGNELNGRLKEMVRQLGAVPLVMDARQHDRVAAFVSHLPHMAATVLAEVVAANREERAQILTLAAGGFRDTTRIAMGNPQMWRDICMTNSGELVVLMDEYIRELGRVRNMVAAGNEAGLLEHFHGARLFRQQVPVRGKGILPAIYNLYVYVADKAGTISEVTGLLAADGINIAEIELLRVREEEGGPLRLGFAREESRQSAAALLFAQGYRAEIEEG